MYYGISDSELVKMVLCGNTGNFIWLVRRHQKDISSLLIKRFSHSLVEFLARKIFIDAFCELESFRKNELFSEWLLVIALRCCHRYRCKIYTPSKEVLVLKPFEQNCLESITSIKCFSDLILSSGANDLRNKILGKLSPEDQLLIEGIFFENYSIKTMARILNCSRLTLRLKAANAKRNMRKIISKSFALNSINNEFNTVKGHVKYEQY